MKNDLQTKIIEDLKHRKKTSREFLRWVGEDLSNFSLSNLKPL